MSGGIARISLNQLLNGNTNSKTHIPNSLLNLDRYRTLESVICQASRHIRIK
jgi:hypothetical protein